MSSAYTSAVLLGSDHVALGGVAVEMITPALAIGISRGRFPKGYSHVDPNEDAVFAATDGTTIVLVAADGHNGFDAARAATEAIAVATPGYIGDLPSVIVRRLAEAAAEAVAATVPRLPEPRNVSRTALTICVVRGDYLTSITLGDTACLVTYRRQTQRVGSTAPFLDARTDASTITIEESEVAANSTITVASDGVLDFIPKLNHTLRSSSKASPSNAVEMIIAEAFAGGAGDNTAVGLARPHV